MRMAAKALQWPYKEREESLADRHLTSIMPQGKIYHQSVNAKVLRIVQHCASRTKNNAQLCQVVKYPELGQNVPDSMKKKYLHSLFNPIATVPTLPYQCRYCGQQTLPRVLGVLP